MKKIAPHIVLFILFILINSCTGYKPIFSSSNLQFEIADYLIGGDKKLGNQIYSKLYNFSRSNKSQEDITSIFLTINVVKEKSGTNWEVGSIERQAFYEEAKKSYVVVTTTDARPFGCFIITKGVIKPDGSVWVL